MYPHDAAGDRLKLQAAGCAAVFEPTTLYHNGVLCVEVFFYLAPCTAMRGSFLQHLTDSFACTCLRAAGGEGSNVVGRESGHPDSHETYVLVEHLQRPLCGGSRPHFFRGVATVRQALDIRWQRCAQRC